MAILAKTFFPGGALIGCNAGTLNTPKIRNTYSNEIWSNCFDGSFSELVARRKNTELHGFQNKFLSSWAGKELKKARNVRPSFKYGLKLGMILTGIDQILFRKCFMDFRSF